MQLPLFYKQTKERNAMKLKKILALTLAVTLMAALFGGCTQPDTPPTTGGTEQKEDTMKQREVGEMLTLQPLQEQLQPTVNDAGMNGTAGRIHLHSNRPEDMAKTAGTEFIYDIGHVDKLGQLHIWNYNASGDTGSGLKEVQISLSEDNKTWSEPQAFVLAQASGEAGMKATNLEDGSFVDFDGKTARYIRIQAQSNHGGDGYGLSELRLFRYKQPIVEGESISCSPLERYINGKWSATEEDYGFLNGSGLSDFRSASATHDNDPAHMFSQKATAIDFTIDLKGQYPLSKLVIWNYNDPDHLDDGLKKFRLKISDDNTTWKTVGSYTVEKADGSAALAPSLVIDFTEEVRGHYLRLEILSNYGGDRVGLSEVSVFLGSGWYCDAVSDYTAMLSNYEGWTGADGIYTVNLDGKDYDPGRDPSQKKTFFIFSDTIVSSVNPITKIRSQVTMPNNTSALLTGGAPDCNQIQFVFPADKNAGSANIVPPVPTPATKPGKFIYYWLGDTFVSGNYLYVYALRIDSVNTVYGFEQNGVDLARYEIVNGQVDYDSLTVIEDKDRRLCDISNTKGEFYFGGAVFQSTEEAGAINPDGYVYVYGYNDVENYGRELVVCRVLPEYIEDFSKYEYLNSDNQWVSEVPAKFMYLCDDIAPECSVSQIQTGPDRGKFIFVNTHITNTPTIMASISDSPFGVFTEKTIIYVHDTCLTTIGKGNNTYNAKAHPALSTDKELIITYNVNGDDCFRYADIYRPRFLRLAMVESRENP